VKHLSPVVALCAVLSACAVQPRAPVPSPAATATTAADAGPALHALFERYFEDTLRLNPLLATYIGDHRYDDQLPNSLGPQFRAEVQASNARYLAEVQAIDVAQLSPADRISHEIFVHERERMRDAERFPAYMLPINQAGSLLTTMAALGSGTNAQPFATTQDYDNWLKRLDGMVTWMDQAIVNMREGAARGVVQPRPVMEKVLVQLEAMVVERPEDGLFFAPVREFPEGVAPADRERLTAAYTAALRDEVVPAFRRLRDFVRDEYLPKTRSTVAWSSLPDGEAWYAFHVQKHTTTTMTPEEIHQVGLAEVARILGEMDRVRRTVGFEGDLEAFFTYLETDPKFYFTKGEDLPRFRRFGGDYTAYVEGWALYSEYLGKELGLFTDPYQWFGRLNDEQLRAMRLVVDTGLHAKGWTREQAIQYMLENSTLAPSDVESEVERYIVWPGQALGYKVGDLALQALRRRAEAELGPKFDLRDFHREVLSDGAVPLDVLEAKIERWIAARK